MSISLRGKPPGSNSDDIRLVERCQRGDRQAFDELVTRYQKRVFNLAYRILGDYEEANDLAQEAFIRVYKKIKSFRREASFYTWLYRLATNLCRNKLRQWQRESRFQTASLHNPIGPGGKELIHSLADPNPGPDEISERREQKILVQKAINSLGEEHQLVIVLRDIQGLAYEEIARIVDCSEGTVKSRLHRARNILKERLEDMI